MTLTLGGMVLALAADLLIAARLGTTVTSDVLIVALTLPRLIEAVGREGSKFSLLSLFVEVKDVYSQERFYGYVGGLLNLFLGIGLVCVVVCWLAAGLLITILGPGLSEVARDQAVLLFRMSIPSTFFALGAAVLSTFLNSQQQFVIVAARNLAVSGVVVLTLLITWSSSDISQWIAATYTLGNAFFFASLLRYSRRNFDYRYEWRAWPSRSDIERLWSAILYPILGLSVRQGGRALEQALASLVAPGAVAAYYFAFRLISALQTIIGVSIATTGLPHITRLLLTGQFSAFTRALWRQLGRVALVSLPIAVFTFVFADNIVGLLYGRGAFDASSIAQTGSILQILALAIIFFSGVPVLNASLYAQHRYLWVLINTVIVVAINLFAAWLFSRTWGLVGIAVAVPFASAISFISLLVMNFVGINRKLRALSYEQV